MDDTCNASILSAAQQQGVAVTVIQDFAHAQDVARRFSLAPQLRATAAPEGRIARFLGPVQSLGVHKGKHQDLPGSRILPGSYYNVPIAIGFLFFLSYTFKRGFIEARDRGARMQAQLAHQARLASIGTLSDGLSHELNNPLAIARGNLELLIKHLRKSGVDDESTMRLLERQLGAYERIATITRGMQQFAHPDSTDQSSVEVAGAVNDTVMLFVPAYQRQGISFGWTMPAGAGGAWWPRPGRCASSSAT